MHDRITIYAQEKTDGVDVTLFINLIDDEGNAVYPPTQILGARHTVRFTLPLFEVPDSPPGSIRSVEEAWNDDARWWVERSGKLFDLIELEE